MSKLIDLPPAYKATYFGDVTSIIWVEVSENNGPFSLEFRIAEHRTSKPFICSRPANKTRLSTWVWRLPVSRLWLQLETPFGITASHWIPNWLKTFICKLLTQIFQFANSTKLFKSLLLNLWYRPESKVMFSSFISAFGSSIPSLNLLMGRKSCIVSKIFTPIILKTGIKR